MQISEYDEYEQGSIVAICIEEDEDENIYIKGQKPASGLTNVKKSSFDEDQLSGTFAGIGDSFSDFNASQEDPSLGEDSPNGKEVKSLESPQNTKMSKGTKSQSVYAPIKINLRGSKYYLQSIEGSIEVGHQQIRKMSDEFFKRQVFIPLFAFQRYDEWANDSHDDKDTLDHHSHKRFRMYLERYIQYLNDKCSKQFNEVLQFCTKQSNKSESIETNSIFSIFSKNVSWVVENIKSLIAKSKFLTLRNSLLSKILSMNEAKQYCKLNKCSKSVIETISQNIESTWKILSQVEFLLSFEATQDYCSKNIEESTSSKFKQVWKIYHSKMGAQKAELLKRHMRELMI